MNASDVSLVAQDMELDVKASDYYASITLWGMLMVVVTAIMIWLG